MCLDMSSLSISTNDLRISHFMNLWTGIADLDLDQLWVFAPMKHSLP